MKDGLFSDSLVTWKWKARHRSWQREAQAWACSRAVVLIDPLVTVKKRTDKEKTPEVKQSELPEFADPLGAVMEDRKNNAVFTSKDLPIISKRKEEPKLANTLVSKEDEIITEKELPGFIPWSSKKQDILKSFSDTEDSKISYLHCVPDLKKSDLSFVKRAAQRLEELEDVSGRKKLAEQSQEENLIKINELRKNLEIAWAKEKKIESVNIAVEVANILGFASATNIYPRQFVLVTDVLDEFGFLVYDRLYTKANSERAEAGLNRLPDNFAVDDVPKQTRDVARNWFCKIGDITEFLPRFYVETALIGCIRFLDAESLSVNLLRLAKIPVSLPNPLVSCYARVYLCRVAIRLTPNDRAPHWRCFNDWINTVPIQPMPALMPALEWIIQCVAYNAETYDELGIIWSLCADKERRSTFLLPFLLAVPSGYLSQHALDACKLVVADENVNCMELCVLGRRLMENNIRDELRRVILKNCWQKVIHLIRMRDFIECTVVWIEFATRYFTLNEIDVMLEIIIKRITPEKKYEAFMDELLCILEKITHWIDEVKDLVVLHHFQKLVNLFRGAQQRGDCAVIVLSSFIRSCELASINDFQLANQILDICQMLHDSLSALSTDEEKQRASFYIIRALDRFKLEADPERALDFFVDARAALSNLDSVIAYLATKVCCLGLHVVRQEKISHAGETFLRGCIAYAFITTASLSSSATKIEVYIQAGMLSLTSNSLPQADAILKCSIEVLAVAHDLKVSVYRSLCSSFLAFLVLVPDPPNKNPLYMFNAFLNAIARYPWRKESLEHGHVLLECICYLSVMNQAELPYHVAYGGVQSNDSLYSGTKEFMEIIEEKNEVVMGRLEDIYKQDRDKLSLLAVEILEIILSLGDVEALATLVIELYGDCVAISKLRERRELILRKIQQFARKNAELERVYEQLYNLEYSVYNKKK
ncbi:hypothetical protein LOAG_05534 [Loa loa]|uniref:G2/mitotic-specific cyclin-B3 n=1 Tax=Loa loa TaxID=7209 RepID=A0A1I7W026_LOALO|nr:hypothetical protein LOAG_05534 [Loa loa]EFO22951.1 hypothetical protein LOAG_05534 [Loa loa]